ncbi:hypothetical protein L207DRAFT_506900 [Hyaloscypha variabilis F]|uniref:DUF3626 domain-containing protein n=1 Tax=Hyaloscypha variabilis (strain UAMH 11265 / GT02V1 / F) TaxID=1149755 RepID=A0A2J6SB69_HYAVF|nr:hypothetical protein L207DRAFT_506900 [Hyaloscypha variabilis F]
MLSSKRPPESLHLSQEKAVAQLRSDAVSLRPVAIDTLTSILHMSNVPLSSLDLAITFIREHASVVLHFHPDRPVGPRTVAEGLLEDGIYKSQFETGISNGSVSAHPGGARAEWERSLFNGAYNDVQPLHRPKYGALDLMRNSDGPAPRFGSCFFVLKPEVSTRSTFTFGGSQADPKYRSTIDELHAILAATFAECFTHDSALGVRDIRPSQLMERILAIRTPSQHRDSPSRNLDHFVEAQVHGDVKLDRDVLELVADPSFQKCEIGRDLEAMSVRYKFPLRWHKGFIMQATNVPRDFRGPSMPSLALRVAREGVVDAKAIGAAVRQLSRAPNAWKEWGTHAEVLQELKLLWHVLVRFGESDSQRDGCSPYW